MRIIPGAVDFRSRIITSVILAPAVIFLTWAGGLAFALTATLLAMLVYYEWCGIISGKLYCILSGWAALIFFSVVCHYVSAPAMMLFISAVGTGALVLLRRHAHFWALTGFFLTCLFLVSLIHIRGDLGGLGTLIFLLIIVWTSDIAGYLFGRMIGGPKLWPRVSPNKTWSGAVGSLLASIFAGLLIAPFYQESAADIAAMALISGVISLVAQGGDLFESYVKRRFGVKDSGSLLPGHGGILDRVDGLIFVVIFTNLALLLYR